jgi:peptide deformylase
MTASNPDFMATPRCDYPGNRGPWENGTTVEVAMPDAILPLGDPRLRLKCAPVAEVADPAFQAENARLQAVLEAFRRAHGFGRGVAAPQIGIPKRFIAINLGQGTRSLINPAVSWRSDATFTLWDDCMCFPDLLVRVRRNLSISVSYLDELGESRTWEHLGQAESELLQHELDHLDGVLATDLALDARSLIYRTAFDADPAAFQCQVDYVIQPTI